ncbi:YhcU family protein [Bacillus sp. CGMCC 1.16607]|uniref:YhcU family protein n=1 Tax=Bacillus sp. CGMCC 1.16607 TaxID=3351842 RepID=UPI00363AEF0E
MKVVYASTPEQEEKIKELIRHFYTVVFPLYFSDEEILDFKRLQVLSTSDRTFEDVGTLKDAYQAITSLQTLCHILEGNHLDPKYDLLFNKNVDTLNELGLSFPFRYENFTCSKNLKAENLSVYSKADNEMLI